jgi:hypothetical protein
MAATSLAQALRETTRTAATARGGPQNPSYQIPTTNLLPIRETPTSNLGPQIGRPEVYHGSSSRELPERQFTIHTVPVHFVCGLLPALSVTEIGKRRIIGRRMSHDLEKISKHVAEA